MIGTIGTFLCVFGSCESHSKLTNEMHISLRPKEMHIPLRLTPKEDTLRR